MTRMGALHVEANGSFKIQELRKANVFLFFYFLIQTLNDLALSLLIVTFYLSSGFLFCTSCDLKFKFENRNYLLINT